MEVAALCPLLLLNLLDFGSAGASLTLSPGRLQFFKFESFSVSCEAEQQQQQEEEEEKGPMKRTADGEVHRCPLPCSIPAAFPATDSGLYWCDAGQEVARVGVNVTVTAGPVILESPALPVTEGDDATLCCRTRASPSNCSRGADFYRDGVLVGTGSTGAMVIVNVSQSHQGLYRCHVHGSGRSPESWLRVKARPPALTPPHPALSSTHLRLLLAGGPYLLATVLLGLVYRDRKREQQAREPQQRPECVIMQTL